MFGNLDIGQRFLNILIFTEIFIYLDICQHFGKLSPFWSKFLNISILGKIFGRILILVKIFEESGFLSKFLKMLILVKIFGKYQFWSKLSKILILVKLFRNHNEGKNFQTILILSDDLAFFQNFKEKYIDFFFSKITKNLYFSLNIRKSRLLLKCWSLSRFSS